MKPWIVRGVLALGVSALGVAHASSIANLSTGIADNGSLIAYGTAEDGWSVTAAPSGITLTNATVVEPSRSFFANFEPDARWVSASVHTNVDAPWGHYTFETSFNVDLAAQSAIAIVGQYAADNRLIDMRLNGHVAFVGPNVSGLSCPSTGCDEFSVPTSFLLDDQSWFVDGVNVLQITIDNQGPTLSNPMSFVVSAVVNANPVPEPGTLVLLLLALSVLTKPRILAIPKTNVRTK